MHYTYMLRCVWFNFFFRSFNLKSLISCPLQCVHSFRRIGSGVTTGGAGNRKINDIQEAIPGGVNDISQCMMGEHSG